MVRVKQERPVGGLERERERKRAMSGFLSVTEVSFSTHYDSTTWLERLSNLDLKALN